MKLATETVEQVVERVITAKFANVLADISFRIKQAYEVEGRGAGRGGMVFAEDLNLPGRHFLTGYVLTNNSPTAGLIAWTDLHMVYNGVDTLITNASTANAYVWWSPITTPTVLQSSMTKPVLASGEVLVFFNSAGIGKVMLSDTNASLPSVLANGSVDTAAILANAVTSTQIANNAVTSAQIAANAVTVTALADGSVARAGQLGTNVVTSTAILANAITAAAIADGAVVRAGQLGTNVVTATQLNANAVTAAALADGSITRSGQLSANVITSTQIADNSVTVTEIAGGAVTATKLAILRHVLY